MAASTSFAQASNERLAINQDKLYYGYIDKAGKYAFPPRAEFGGDFHEGLAWVSEDPVNNRRRYSVIDTKGSTRFECLCDFKQSDFCEGLAIVHRSEGYIYIGTDGKQAVPGAYKSASPFCDGKAKVVLNEGLWQRVVIDKGGKVLRDLPVSDPSDWFEASSKFIDDGTARPLFVMSEVETDHGWHTHFSEGLAAVAFLDKQNTTRFAFIDQSFHREILLDEHIAQVGDFHEGMAPVLVRKQSLSMSDEPEDLSNRLGFIDLHGAIVVEPKYFCDHISFYRFSEGLAAVRFDGLTWYIDKAGKHIATAVHGDDFHDGLASTFVPVTASGEVIDPNDLSHGYQSQVAYRDAFRACVEKVTSEMIVSRPIEFTVHEDNHRQITNTITLSAGDAAFENKLKAHLNALRPPLRGVTIAKDGIFDESFRLENGKLSRCFQKPGRRVKIVPTLPEGAPIPDNE